MHVFGQINCENLLFLFMIHFIINLLFVIPLIIGHLWTLLVTEMSPISAAMCSLFRLGQVYVANDIL